MDKIEAEKRAQEEAERLKLEEAERIEQEKIAKEKAIKEEKLKNTRLHSVKGKGYQNLANNVIVYSNLKEDLIVKTANDKATYNVNEITSILPFNKGLVQISVIS